MFKKSQTGERAGTHARLQDAIKTYLASLEKKNIYIYKQCVRVDLCPCTNAIFQKKESPMLRESRRLNAVNRDPDATKAAVPYFLTCAERGGERIQAVQAYILYHGYCTVLYLQHVNVQQILRRSMDDYRTVCHQNGSLPDPAVHDFTLVPPILVCIQEFSRPRIH